LANGNGEKDSSSGDSPNSRLAQTIRRIVLHDPEFPTDSQLTPPVFRETPAPLTQSVSGTRTPPPREKPSIHSPSNSPNSSGRQSGTSTPRESTRQLRRATREPPRKALRLCSSQESLITKPPSLPRRTIDTVTIPIVTLEQLDTVNDQVNISEKKIQRMKAELKQAEMDLIKNRTERDTLQKIFDSQLRLTKIVSTRKRKSHVAKTKNDEAALKAYAPEGYCTAKDRSGYACYQAANIDGSGTDEDGHELCPRHYRIFIERVTRRNQRLDFDRESDGSYEQQEYLSEEEPPMTF